MSEIPADVEARIAIDFPEEREIAMGALRKLATELDREGPRVLRCVLFLARGELSRLMHNAEQARLDYRDVIYWAEYDEQERQARDFNQPFDPPA